MSKTLLVMKMIARTRVYLLIVVLSLLVIIMGIIGSIIISANTVNYASIKLGERVRDHVKLSFRVEPSSYNIYKEFDNNITNYIDRILKHDEIHNISLIKTLSISIPGILVGINISDINVSIRLLQGLNTIGSVVYSSDRIVFQGVSGGSAYIDKDFIRENISIKEVIGKKLLLKIVDQVRKEEVYQLETSLDGVFDVIQDNISTQNMFSMVSTGFELERIALFVSLDSFDSIVKELLERYGGLYREDGFGRIELDYIVSIRLKENYIPLYDPDLALRTIDEFIDNVVDKEALRTLGYSIKPKTTTFLFFTIHSSTSIHVSRESEELMGSVDLRSPLKDVITASKGLGQAQMAQQVVFSVVIPLFIGSWFLLSTTSTLLIDYLRRGIALLYTRGVSIDLIKSSYILLLVVAIIITSLVAVPLGVYAGNYIASLMYSRLYAKVFPTDLTLYIVSLIIASITIALLFRSISKLFKKTKFDLTLVTRIYAPTPREEWKPSTLLIVFTILSTVKYAMWIAGVTVADLMLYASRSGNMGLVIAVVIYAILDLILRIIAPYVITYFIVMYITHSERILGFLSKTLSRIVSGKYYNEVSQIISKGSSRLYKASFIIALVLAIAFQYIGLSSSYSEWYPGVKEFYQQLLGSYALLMEYIMEGNLYAFKSVVLYGVALAVLSSILVAIVMTRDLEKELVVLRARGGGKKDIIRILYGVIFTLVVLSMIVGFIAGGIWLRGSLIVSYSSLKTAIQGTGLKTNQTIPEPSIVFKPVDIAYIVLIISILLILPLLSILYWFRKPVVEKIRGVMS